MAAARAAARTAVFGHGDTGAQGQDEGGDERCECVDVRMVHGKLLVG